MIQKQFPAMPSITRYFYEITPIFVDRKFLMFAFKTRFLSPALSPALTNIPGAYFNILQQLLRSHLWSVLECGQIPSQWISFPYIPATGTWIKIKLNVEFSIIMYSPIFWTFFCVLALAQENGIPLSLSRLKENYYLLLITWINWKFWHCSCIFHQWR